MRYYEILYIVHSALEGGHLEDIIKSVDELLGKHGGKVESTDIWGKKRLAYLIEKQSYGTYILTQFSVDEPKNNLILESIEQNPNILASLISKIEEDELNKDSENNVDKEVKRKEAPAKESKDEEATAEESKDEEATAEESKDEEAPAEESKDEEAPAEEGGDK